MRAASQTHRSTHRADLVKILVLLPSREERRVLLRQALVEAHLTGNGRALVGVHAQVAQQQAAAEHEPRRYQRGSRRAGAENIQAKREQQTAEDHAAQNKGAVLPRTQRAATSWVHTLPAP